jgi:pyruvate dehydrogenase E1 component beta subunit
VGVHRALEAARILEAEDISAEVIDLRCIAPLDQKTIVDSVSKTGRLLVVDEDYETFSLSGELAAVSLEADIPFRFARVCTQTTIPYARHLEDQILPNVERICAKVRELITKKLN